MECISDKWEPCTMILLVSPGMYILHQAIMAPCPLLVVSKDTIYCSGTEKIVGDVFGKKCHWKSPFNRFFVVNDSGWYAYRHQDAWLGHGL